MIRDPEQIFSFGFVLGIATGWVMTRLWDVVRRMDQRADDDKRIRQELRMRQWEEQ